MATQHPDSASRRVTVSEEPDEAVDCCRRDGLGCDEYLVDYMGKLTPYHQIGIIVKKMIEETDLVPGEDVYITPRMVSSFREEPFRQLMTTLAVVEGIYECYKKFGVQGVHYIVQAFTSTLEDLRLCKERSESVLRLVGRHLKIDTGNMGFRMLPLFGGLAEQLSIDRYLPNLIETLQVNDFIRIFIGKSETAMLYGHMASTLSCKLAISESYGVAQKYGIDLYPILGVGALPFRGHLTLENVENVLSEYRGARTYTVQSGLRYDHGADKTKRLIERLRSGVNLKPLEYSEDEVRNMKRSIFIFAKNYLIELSEIQDIVRKVSDYIPKQRERLLDFEEVSYYRELRNVQNILSLCEDETLRRNLVDFMEKAFKKPPRWFKFVASLYTCGLPPEFLGTGKALKEIKETLGSGWVDKLVEEVYPSIKEDLRFASRFLITDPESNMLLTERILEGIELLRENFEFEELDESYRILSQITSSYLKEALYGKPMERKRLAILISEGDVAEYLDGNLKDNLSRMILDLGKIRKSLA